MTALHRKLLRDLWWSRTQVLSIQLLSGGMASSKCASRQSSVFSHQFPGTHSGASAGPTEDWGTPD